jgi:hypothetical protein
MLTGSAHGQTFAHCLFVIRNIAFIPHGASLVHSAFRFPLPYTLQAKRTFLRRTKPQRWCSGVSVVPIPMVRASFSFTLSCAALCFNLMHSPDGVVQYHAWLHQLLPPPCTAIKNFLRSGVVARSTAGSPNMWLLLGSSVRVRSPCTC